MTGFGRGVAEHAGTRVAVDIRSVNHRFLDLKLRGTLAPALEEAISQRVRAAIERGSISVQVHFVQTAGVAKVDLAAAGAAHVQLAEVARALGLPGPDLALVLAHPGVLASRGDEELPDAVILGATDAALAQLQTMRASEGAALARELTARLGELARLREQIAGLSRDVPGQLRARLLERIGKLEGLEPQRVAQEVALLADRADVTEELVRLASHLEQARALVAGPGSVGRRLDFLVQELGRELNTIGSKSALAEITALVVEGKAVLEKVREQVQNVE
ncbi:MAG TPA: YicC/YloC family endoribonuclease [Kofleriaceae bacterium]|nr:YicC/YloC family endoribonuclease [Kofleriaceae bacterium]